MNKQSLKIISIGLFQAAFILLSSYFHVSPGEILNDNLSSRKEVSLEQKALNILEVKCNTCHRRQNPFMVFKEKNMGKRAMKIYQMVFVERRMPKPEGVPLTSTEYALLKAWLSTQNVY